MGIARKSQNEVLLAVPPIARLVHKSMISNASAAEHQLYVQLAEGRDTAQTHKLTRVTWPETYPPRLT
jgi:hypothetical protein